jgi:WD40 repeat protein
LRELLALEITRRRTQGEVPTADEYRRRFPDLPSWLDELLAPSPPALPGSTVSLVGASPPARESLPSLPGYSFSGRQLGEGGMAVVWRGRDERLHRDVAVKVLRSAFVGHPAIVQRFEEEAQLTSQLQHPGIPPVHESGTLADGRPYFCMKVVKGRTLDDLLRERGGPSEDLPRFLQVFEQVCQAAGYGHSKGVIHRDLKPSNVMVGAFGEVQVMDWGLGKVLSQEADSRRPEPKELGPLVSVVETDRAGVGDGATQLGSVLGTYAYMPPEQALGDVDRVDTRSDVFGLGAILCEILTGHPPYQGTAAEMKARAQLADLGPAYECLRSCGADQVLVSLAERCLRKEPNERLADGGAVAGEVALYQADVRRRWQQAEVERATAEAESRRVAAEAREKQARETAKSERRARRLAWGLAAALALGLTGTSCFFVLARRQAAEVERQRQQAVVLGEDLKRLKYSQQIALAQLEWEADNARNAWNHLESTNPEFRGWEFRYLYHLFNHNQTTLEGHVPGTQIRSVAFRPDGRYLASAGDDKTVKIWDTATGRLSRSLRHAVAVACVAFSPNGKFLASGGQNLAGKELNNQPAGEVKLWDAESLEELGTSKFLAAGVWCVAFDPDSKLLAASTGDDGLLAASTGDDGGPGSGEIRVWNVGTWQEFKILKGHKGSVRGVAFGRNGHLASGGTDGTVRIWDVMKGEQVGSPLVPSRTPEGSVDFKGGGIWVVRNVAFSPDGRQVAAAYWDGTARIWDTATRKVHDLEGHKNSVQDVAFSPDGKLLASASWDGTAKIWDVETDREVQALKGHRDRVFGLEFSPDGGRLATGCADGTVKLWDVTKGHDVPALRGHTEEVTGVSFHPDGWRLASGSVDGTVKVWDLTKGRALLTLTKHKDTVDSVAFSPDGRYLASGSGDNTVVIWDTTACQYLGSLAKHTAGVTCLAFSPDSRYLASGSEDETAMIWDLATGQVLHTLREHSDTVNAVAFSPDGKYLASCGAERDKRVMIWDVPTGTLVHTLEGHQGSVTNVAFSPDGRLLASVSNRDNTARLWDMATGRGLRSLDARDRFLAVCFDPEGQRLATADADRNVKLWDVESGQNVLILRGHTGKATCLSFSRDGTRLASGGWDKTIRIWEAPRLEGTPAASTSPPDHRPPAP